MPSRILREGINSSARINALSAGAELLYRRLMSVADDYGRFHAAPQTVLGACWPTTPDKVCPQDVSKWLAECQQGERPLLAMYDVDGARYLQITDFNQKERSKSRFPEPAGNLSADCPQDVSTRRNAQCASYDADALGANAAAPPVASATLMDIDLGWDIFRQGWVAAGLTGPSVPDWNDALHDWRKLDPDARRALFREMCT